MKQELWRKVEDLFHAALERTPVERQAFLDGICGADTDLRRHVELLLAKGEQAGSFLEVPAIENMPVTLTAAAPLLGRQFGPYHIVSPLGAGGMGEVYRAHDSKLDRDVAIKTLPQEFARDPERLSRLRREARTLASVNHPNIAAIYGLEESEETNYLVLELVEGETLRGALPVHTALDRACQVAAALEAAHEKGIIHRDLKPANVKVTPQGMVKVLDFGLAKAIWGSQGKQDLSQLAAVTGVESVAGQIVGTPGYMSPEQARGRDVDKRTDIWAFGCLLYELLTGKRAFAGETLPDAIAVVLEREPDWHALPAKTPPKIRELLRQCLQKDAGRRPADIADARRAIEEAQRGWNRWREVAIGAAAVATLVIAAALWGVLWRSRQSRKLTEKDTIVLADFTNTTGDPVFDDTLKQALTVHLEQSPFLNILPQQTVDDTLKLMGRSPGQHLTREVARDLCQRTGSRAMLAGSIASLGSQYVIGVNAVDCQTGNTLAQGQVTADSKELVLTALGETTSELRKKLGESLSTIQKFDTPLEQATTSSLEALKAYTLSRETMNEKSEVAAIPMMKHAIELDPNFALAYAKMGIMYSNIGEATLASQYSQKAYDLRDRVSEREKFRITGSYYRVVTGELEKAVQTYELWAQNYPRDSMPHGYLGFFHSVGGQYEKSVAEELESNHLGPDAAPNLENLMLAYAALNRFDEAIAIYQEATGHKLDHEGLHVYRYGLAMVEGDAAEMERQVAWGAGKLGVEDMFLSAQSDTEAFSGRFGKARELSRRAVELARRNQQNGTAAGWQTNLALREAEVGLFDQSRKDAAAASALSSDRFTQVLRALALARAGDSAGAQKMADNVAKEFPLDTVVHSYWLPAIGASLALNRHEPAKAIELLQPAATYELGLTSPSYMGSLYPVYVRGQAYLLLHQGDEAAAEFQKFLDHRGIVFNFPLGGLAHLGLARAYTLSGDTTKAKTAYQDFFALWKDADPDIPVLREAKAEYAKLQ